MRIAILLLGVGFCCSWSVAHAGKRVVERVVAVVDGNIILASELEQQLAPMRAQAEQIVDPKERERRIGKLHNQALEDMISEELIVQAAEAAKVTIDPEEVRAAIEDVKQQNKLDDAGLSQALASQGLTIDSYKKLLGRTLLRHRAVNQLVGPKVAITEEDIRARYGQMQRRSEAVSAVAVAHVLFVLPEHPTEQQLAEAKARAAQVIDRAKAGEPFDKLVAELSEDAGTKATGARSVGSSAGRRLPSGRPWCSRWTRARSVARSRARRGCTSSARSTSSARRRSPTPR